MAVRLSRRETGKIRLSESIFRIDIELTLIVEYHGEHPHSFTFFCPPSDHPIVTRGGKEEELLGTAIGINLAISLSS
jgi:hypothetical protein